MFTAFYSTIPEHNQSFRYLFAGLDGHTNLVAWMWTSTLLAFTALGILTFPRIRRKEGWLAFACAFVFVSLWIEKGLGLVVTGFIPSPLEKINEYAPTALEIGITLGVWAGGLLILTILYRIFVAVRSSMNEVAASAVTGEEVGRGDL